MRKRMHEIRDPIHGFVQYDDQERRVIDSRPFQRLRHIHQLGTSHLVYPGTSHKRFEHSLGVMHLATRVFDVITDPERLSDGLRELLPEVRSDDQVRYWRLVLRMAALCHDLGHTPFSHATEDLLPVQGGHETITRRLICEAELAGVWQDMTPCLRAGDVAKLAVGPKKYSQANFSDWEAVLSEIIVGDAFGVDRMDYLLRDAYHAGVAYGTFDHDRVIQTLRVLEKAPEQPGEDRSLEPGLGVELGGLHAAEGLLIARYFMYTQVYLHPVRRVLDLHLRECVSSLRKGKPYPEVPAELLEITDNEITSAMYEAAWDAESASHEAARRVMRREHYRLIHQSETDRDSREGPTGRARKTTDEVWNHLSSRHDSDDLRRDTYDQDFGLPDFPVLLHDGTVSSSIPLSDVLAKLPVIHTDNIYINPEKREEAAALLEKWMSEEGDHDAES